MGDKVIESAESTLVVPEHQLPDQLVLIPITGRPFFPAQIQPIFLSEDPWASTLADVAKNHGVVGLCYIKGSLEDSAEAKDFPTIGCAVRMHNLTKEDGEVHFIAQGLKRFEITQWTHEKMPFHARVSYLPTIIDEEETVKAYAMSMINIFKDLIPLNPLYSEEVKHYLRRFSPNDPCPLTDFAAAITTAKGQDLQEVLEITQLEKRMKRVLYLLRKELEVAQLQQELSEQVNRKVADNQRNFFLHEQLKIIERELGITKDGTTTDIEEYQARLEGKTVPQKVQKIINAEISKLRSLQEASPEYSVCRSYLDWLTIVPWGVLHEDNLDIVNARKVLDEDHEGLADVKDRIIEFLAVAKYKGGVSGSILLMVGPPGVGKTSIGHSIAKTLGRPLYRFSVGGMRDEAEIKGHRRTYIGAMPGKLIQALKDVEVSNPVILLDEIDKMGQSYHGDPASALLEVLDPEQNKDFLDHYLDVRVDLSNVLFVCTANQTDNIPPPLLDRMDIIRLSGYITEEKLSIARKHLWPKQLAKAGVKPRKIKISDATLRLIINDYAREAGVRNLEKLLAKIIRKGVVRLLKDPDTNLSITGNNLQDYLGSPIFKDEERLSGVGVVTGLAWTSMGGATLPIEARAIYKQDRILKITGQLGDVMRESANIAISVAESLLDTYSLPKDYFATHHIHLHIPEGATPKDGPSAGITMATALLSLASHKKPKHCAMTGELTLSGHVFGVGGIREKVVAAKRMGIKSLIIPEANKGDFDELPPHLKQGLKVTCVTHIEEVIHHVLGLNPDEKPVVKNKHDSKKLA